MNTQDSVVDPRLDRIEIFGKTAFVVANPDGTIPVSRAAITACTIDPVSGETRYMVFEVIPSCAAALRQMADILDSLKH